jgi:hypothetical protein
MHTHTNRKGEIEKELYCTNEQYDTDKDQQRSSFITKHNNKYICVHSILNGKTNTTNSIFI